VGSLLAEGHVIRRFQEPAKGAECSDVLLSAASLPTGKARLQRRQAWSLRTFSPGLTGAAAAETAAISLFTRICEM